MQCRFHPLNMQHMAAIFKHQTVHSLLLYTGAANDSEEIKLTFALSVNND